MKSCHWNFSNNQAVVNRISIFDTKNEVMSIVIMFEFILAYWSRRERTLVHLIRCVHWYCRCLSRTHNCFQVIKVTSSSTTSEVIARALVDFGLTNVNADKYSLVEVLLISNVNYTDRILEPDEYPLHVLRQQRKVNKRFDLFVHSFVDVSSCLGIGS
jgi:hypothetical protein